MYNINIIWVYKKVPKSTRHAHPLQDSFSYIKNIMITVFYQERLKIIIFWKVRV
jgi:hypothetical protein